MLCYIRLQDINHFNKIFLNVKTIKYSSQPIKIIKKFTRQYSSSKSVRIQNLIKICHITLYVLKLGYSAKCLLT